MHMGTFVLWYICLYGHTYSFHNINDIEIVLIWVDPLYMFQFGFLRWNVSSKCALVLQGFCRGIVCDCELQFTFSYIWFQGKYEVARRWFLKPWTSDYPPPLPLRSEQILIRSLDSCHDRTLTRDSDRSLYLIVMASAISNVILTVLVQQVRAMCSEFEQFFFAWQLTDTSHIWADL